MYLLDANVFIEAKRFYYSFQIAPGYWEWLFAKFKSKEFASVRAVYDELSSGDDELSSWVKTAELREFWLPDTADSLSAMTELASWAAHPDRQYKGAAVDEFMSSADFRLAAQGKALGAVVVTRETSDPGSRRRVKLPDAAAHLGVRSVQPFEIYERLGLRLTAPAAD